MILPSSDSDMTSRVVMTPPVGKVIEANRHVTWPETPGVGSYVKLYVLPAASGKVMWSIRSTLLGPYSMTEHWNFVSTIRSGNDGDLTILLADPAAGELRDFSRVAYTIRAGRVIFDATAH